jgi:DNA-binding transcriptional regulator YdaS (Cro superfamily)
MEIKTVFDKPGMRAAIAQKCGVSLQAIAHWKVRGIPAEYCPDIEEITSVRCEILRPDVNWAILRKTPRKQKVTA